MVCSRDFQGVVLTTPGELGGVAEGLWVGVALTPRCDILGLDRGEELGLLLTLAFRRLQQQGKE